MEKIIVFDVPAATGGALTILNQYYDKALNDKEKEWTFIISTPNLKSTKNVTVLKYPWVKKSWFHRLYFDKVIARKIIKKSEVDQVLSLQNVIIENINVKQTLYLHQPLPFVEKRYKVHENFKFWIYQNIISKMIFKSIAKADKVIVQTEWMKRACLEKVKTNPQKFEVKQPTITIEVKRYYKQDDELNKLFFYPSGAMEYKNHRIIVETARELVEEGISSFRIIFTLLGNENKHIRSLYKTVKDYNLPIDFVGTIGLEEVYNYYSKSILIFPSYIETFGLPLLESKLHHSPIIASDCAFSHEILDGYDKVEFFNPFNEKELRFAMYHFLK